MYGFPRCVPPPLHFGGCAARNVYTPALEASRGSACDASAPTHDDCRGALRGAHGGGVAGLVSGVGNALAVDGVGVDIDILLAVGLVNVEVVTQ